MQSPESESTSTRMATVQRALRPVRGPVRLLDLSSRPPPAHAGGHFEEPEDAMDEEPVAPARSPAAEEARAQPPTLPQSDLPTGPAAVTTTANSVANEVGPSEPTAGAEDIETSGGELQNQVPMAHSHPAEAGEQPPPLPQSDPRGAPTSSTNRERSRSPPRSSSNNEQILDSLNPARTMDGLPKLQEVPEQSQRAAVVGSTAPLYDLQGMEIVDEALLVFATLKGSNGSR